MPTKMLHLLVASTILVFCDFAGILIGFFAFKIFGGYSQLAVQLPVAFAVTALAFLTATSLALVLRVPFLRHDKRSVIQVYLLALVLGPALFAVYHYITQHYVTSAGNLLALTSYQLMVNAAALALARAVGKRSCYSPL